MAYGTGGHIVFKDGSGAGAATVTETATYALAAWDYQTADGRGIRPRRVTISNDSAAESLLYRFDAAADQMTLLLGETIVHENVSDALYVESGANTCEWRAWGEG
jgi:hypothetical protein